MLFTNKFNVSVVPFDFRERKIRKSFRYRDASLDGWMDVGTWKLVSMVYWLGCFPRVAALFCELLQVQFLRTEPSTMVSA